MTEIVRSLESTSEGQQRAHHFDRSGRATFRYPIDPESYIGTEGSPTIEELRPNVGCFRNQVLAAAGCFRH